MHKTKRNFLLFASLLGVSVITAVATVGAIIAPEIYFTSGPNLEKNTFNAGETIKGTVSLQNQAGSAIGDLSLKMVLLQKNDEDKSKIFFLAQTTDAKKFDLTAGETVTRDFSYITPANLPAGDMIFRVQIVTGKGEELAWADKKIGILNGGKFLVLDNWWIVKDGKKIDPGVGAYYENGQTAPEVVFDVTNGSGEAIKAFYTITNYKRNSGTPATAQDQKPAMTLEAGKKNTITIILPKENLPESYLSEIQFFDEATKQPISNPITFRWIITGENGKIIFAVLDKDAYAAGETAQVKVDYVGSANPVIVDMGKGIIEAAVYDKGGNEAGKTEKEVDFKESEVIIPVAIKIDVADPKLAVKITKDGKSLDDYTYSIETRLNDAGGKEITALPVEENKKADNSIMWLVFGAGLVLILIIIIKMKNKNNKTGAKTLSALLVLAGALAAGEVQAVTKVAGCDWTTVWNNPRAGLTLYPGDKVRFEGYVQISSCGNASNPNKFEFYIAEDKDMPIVDCLGRNYSTGCSNCEATTCGAAKSCFGCGGGCNSGGQCGWSGEFYGGNRVMWVDTAAAAGAGKKVYKLGSRCQGWSSGNKAYFDYTFTIPKDIAISGPVRFYMNWAGNHGGQGWQYAIYYQRATIIPNNIPPVANNDSYTGSKNDDLIVAAANGVLKNDTDADGDPLTSSMLKGSTANGYVTLSADGGFIYTPKSGFVGTDSFTYTASDGKANSSPATVTVNVVKNNTAPTAVADNYNVTSGASYSNNVLLNDTDVDGDSLAAVLVTNANHGTLTLKNNGIFTYKPTGGFTGTDSFTYKANDGEDDSNTATVTFTVAAGNNAPTAAMDSYEVDMDVAQSGNVLANDSDPDGDPLTAFLLIDNTDNGNLALNPDGNFTYTPNSGFAGVDTFTYVANDGEADSNAVTATFNVRAVAPVATGDGPYTVFGGGQISLNVDANCAPADPATPVGVLCNDTDPNGDSLAAYKSYPDTDNGKLKFHGDGSFEYTPDSAFVGTDTFTYQAFDGEHYSLPATVTIKVLPPPPFSAKMECTAANCDTTAFCISNPNRPGCACDNTPGAPWVMYWSTPETDNPCNFKINNKSTGNIDWSTWNFAGASYNHSYPKQAGKANYGTVPSSVLNDNYNVTLKVEQGAASATDSRSLSVRNDIQAGFACSLDQVKWQDCAVIANKVAKGEKIYFKDSASTLKSHSIASSGSNIEQRVWTFNGVKIIKLDGVPVLPDQQEVFASLAEGNNTITLEVKDGNGRTDAKTYPLESFSLPKWQEVSPVSMMDNLMAAAYRVFAAIFWPV